MMQWYILERKVLKTAKTLLTEEVAYADEAGTGLATIVSPYLDSAADKLCTKDVIESRDGFMDYFAEKIVKPSFIKIYKSWSQMNWQGARHLMTDRIYSVNNRWIEFCRNMGLVNRLEEIEIERIIPAKVSTDLCYQAVTVRIFASCYDYVEDAKGKVIGGSKRKRRIQITACI